MVFDPNQKKRRRPAPPVQNNQSPAGQVAQPASNNPYKTGYGSKTGAPMPDFQEAPAPDTTPTPMDYGDWFGPGDGYVDQGSYDQGYMDQGYMDQGYMDGYMDQGNVGDWFGPGEMGIADNEWYAPASQEVDLGGADMGSGSGYADLGMYDPEDQYAPQDSYDIQASVTENAGDPQAGWDFGGLDDQFHDLPDVDETDYYQPAHPEHAVDVDTGIRPDSGGEAGLPPEETPPGDDDYIDQYLEEVFGEGNEFDPSRSIAERDAALRALAGSMAARGMTGSGAHMGMAGDVFSESMMNIGELQRDWKSQRIQEMNQAASMLFQDKWKNLDMEHQEAMAVLMFELSQKQKYGEDYDPNIGDYEFQLLLDILNNPDIQLDSDVVDFLERMMHGLFPNMYYDDTGNARIP